MISSSRMEDLRAAQSPLLNNRKLRLGTFGTNLSGACTISSIEGTLRADWATTLRLAQCADRMDFEAIVPIARWRGMGGVTNFNEESFETLTWAAALGALTKNPAIFATSHVPTVHPVMLAKQAMTIDHVTSGRFCLNVVNGWYKPEIEMFGAKLLDHNERYDCAEEWLQIIKLLWTEVKPFDFEGKYYHVPQGMMKLKPVQKPYPLIMNAGGSERGMHFAAKNCDVVFVTHKSHDLESLQAQVREYRDMAFHAYGRELRIWCQAYVVQGETKADAEAYRNECVEKGDFEALDNLLTSISINQKNLPKEVAERLRLHFLVGFNGYPLVGTKEQIVEGLSVLVKAGFDGVLLAWPRYEQDMLRFEHEVYPLLVQEGLRQHEAVT
jgi:dimethylsulfone monooxygenase